MRKNTWIIVAALFVFSVLLPMQAKAAGRDGLRLDENGTVTVVSRHAAQEKISSMSFSLSVESAGTAEFEFIENTTEILEFRYDTDARRLNIYLAGTEALFAEGTDSLTVGRIIVRDESGRDTEARVSVVEDSLKYVYGAELRTMENPELPGTVQINSVSTPGVSSPPAVIPPTQAQTPEEPDESDGSEDDSSAQTPAPIQPPVSMPVKPPTQAQGGTSSPQTTPAHSQSVGSMYGSTGNNSSVASSALNPSASSLPGNTPERDEDGFIFPGLSDEEDTKQTSGSKGLNVLLIVVAIVSIIVLVVEVVAFVVVKKKPRDKKP